MRLFWVLVGIGLVGTAVVIFIFGSRQTPSPEGPADQTVLEPPWFEDISRQVGLDFVHDPGPVGKYFMPQIMGSGGAFLDFNNDGRLDVYLIQNGDADSRSTNRLYRQTPEGKLVDASKGSGLDIAGHGMGVAVGDVNNDGWVDVVVTEYGATRLFLNQHDGSFRDATKDAGIDNPLWGTSASFVDYDRDGWLDLVVVNYVDYDPSIVCQSAGGRADYCHPRMFGGRVTRLYHNLSRANPTEPRFEDATLASGLGRAPGPGLGVVCADFNGDAWPDIFIANDSAPNHLWINQQNGTFVEEAVLRGVAYNRMGAVEAGMGVAAGDVDGNGLVDLFVTHLTDETHTLWLQGPRGRFQDRTVAAGLATPRWRGTGFGAVLADFDHDGHLDIAVANGRVARKDSSVVPGSDSFWSHYAERNQLFGNDGSGRFRDVSPSNRAFCETRAISRGLAWGDFDGDGAPDLLVTAIAGPARLYRNVAPNRGHWLSVRAEDSALHRDAYGAEITVHAGKRRWLRQVNPGQSYLSSGDPRAHFGLGKTASVDEIRVLWPDGSAETFPGGAVDRSIVLRKGQGKRP
jgi:hypothetical protein